METTFSLVATYQYYENYGAHNWDGEGECPQYWKAKGGEEQVVLEGLTLDEVVNKLNSENLARIVWENELESDHYNRYELLSYQLVEISERTLRELFNHLCETDEYDLSYIRYCWEGGEHQFDKLVAELVSRGILDAPINKTTWDVVCFTILKQEW